MRRMSESKPAYLRDKAESPAASARPGGTPNSMDIVSGLLRQLIVDDQVHCRDVEASACHVSGDQDGHLS